MSNTQPDPLAVPDAAVCEAVEAGRAALRKAYGTFAEWDLPLSNAVLGRFTEAALAASAADAERRGREEALAPVRALCSKTEHGGDHAYQCAGCLAENIRAVIGDPS